MLSAGGGARVGWWPLLVTTFITSATPSPSSTIVGLASIFIVSTINSTFIVSPSPKLVQKKWRGSNNSTILDNQSSSFSSALC